MWRCHYCGFELPLASALQNRCCTACGSEIHSCRNCVHFDESLSSKCHEPDTPWIAERAALNECTLFELRPASVTRAAASGGEAEAAKEAAKKAFRALFRDLD